MKHKMRNGVALLIGIFGALTLFMSSAVIFDVFGIRELEGNYVLFNFVCGFLYLITAYGLLKSKPWTTSLLLLSLGILIASFIALGFYISSGGIYETKTIKSMIFRITITAFFAFLSRYIIKRRITFK